MSNSRFQRGQSMLELIIALAVSVIIITAVVVAASNSVRNSTYSKNNAASTRYAQEGMEWLRSQRDQSWTTFSGKASAGSGTDWCIQTLSWPGINGVCSSSQTIANTSYLRQVNLKLKDYAPPGAPDGINDTVEATLTVKWTEGTLSHDITLTTQFTNWKTK